MDGVSFSDIPRILLLLSIPILLVTAHARPRWTDDGRLSVLVPLDGSTFAEAALGPAGELARLALDENAEIRPGRVGEQRRESEHAQHRTITLGAEG